MATVLRETTLQTIGLGTVLDIFQNGRLPVSTGDLVDKVFGNSGARGSLVVSGANGIVGAGKTMQLGSRLQPYDVKVVALDFPSAPDGLGNQYPGLVQAFGQEGADRIMRNIIRMYYDGAHLPDELKDLNPRFLLEAIPEILEIKRAHYETFRSAFPDIEIRSVTSGFPSSELGVGIAHPAFPHEINKIWEVVESEPSAITQLLWAMGLIPIPVADRWSFILDVLFCGITLAGSRYRQANNMPYWKIDKYARKLVGPNPFRAHDAIGTKGATFLTWSCLHHLSEKYGALFTPTPDMEERKETGQSWYPPNHFRPLVDWPLDKDAYNAFHVWILGPLFQMTSLMLQEKRGHLAHMNAIGELCAQFRRGVVALIRDFGPQTVVATVEAYHAMHPEAAEGAWFPEAFEAMDSPEWQQLYVNAEHNGDVGVITISRETYSWDVDHELNRAIDWLKREGIDKVIVSSDFHMSTQMIGADTSEFFPTLQDFDAGYRITSRWSATGRRLNDEFATSVGFVNGKRCLGGMLELLVHCHYLVSVDDAQLGWPEVTLPVVPGMEGCHWPIRKAESGDWPRLLHLLMTGRPIKAADSVGWLVDYAGPLDEALPMTWKLASGGDHGIAKRTVETRALYDLPTDLSGLPPADSPEMEAARAAIMECVQVACGADLSEALTVQAKLAAEFLTSSACQAGVVGAEYARTMAV